VRNRLAALHANRRLHFARNKVANAFAIARPGRISERCQTVAIGFVNGICEFDRLTTANTSQKESAFSRSSLFHRRLYRSNDVRDPVKKLPKNRLFQGVRFSALNAPL
jgi:hypothetical protein